MAIGRDDKERKFGVGNGPTGEAGATQEGEGVFRVVAQGMAAAAEGIRRRIPRTEAASRTAERVAETLDRGGRYLASRDVPKIADDATALVQRYPMQAIWVGLGLGFILGRVVSARRR